MEFQVRFYTKLLGIFCNDRCFEGNFKGVGVVCRAEIFTIYCFYFVRNNDFKNSFEIY